MAKIIILTLVKSDRKVSQKVIEMFLLSSEGGAGNTILLIIGLLGLALIGGALYLLTKSPGGN